MVRCSKCGQSYDPKRVSFAGVGHACPSAPGAGGLGALLAVAGLFAGLVLVVALIWNGIQSL